MRKPGRRFAAAVIGLVACAVTQLAAADVDRTHPPNVLCTGAQCPLFGNVMQANCTIDFGNRNVVVLGDLVVPDGGTLSLRG